MNEYLTSMYYKISDTIKYHSKNICKVKLDDMS